MWVFLAIISLIGALGGTYSAKLWIKTGNIWFLAGILIGALVSWVGWVLALRSERLVLVEGLWGAASLIFTIGMGFLIFHEKVSLQEGIGVFLALLATILLVGKF